MPDAAFRRPKQIWLVEDNPDHALLISTVLEDVPVPLDLVLIPTGEQALERLAVVSADGVAGWPACVLLDLKLPQVDGFQVLRAFRAPEVRRRVPVAILSTSAAPNDIERCLAGGANAYLTKSASLPDLAAQVQQLIGEWLT